MQITGNVNFPKSIKQPYNNITSESFVTLPFDFSVYRAAFKLAVITEYSYATMII